ncbi:HIT-like protein [Thelephora terrestris]|uniref:HIT-like protein n=1 Tax=Thelephora terrestris TaxID=56493 RepID=A0A9P6LCB7_9AGAM|nr:HIT-like protein [Thelephora terrestris]
MMFDLTILQKYAKRSPSSLPPTLLLTNSETSLTIFDKYPKATYHFLVLPRITADSGFTADELENLQTLLARGKKAEARGLIEGLKKDAQTAKEMVEKEMLKRHGYKWDVWIGFHAVPSLTHLHLHVISSDLCSPSLKHKKHYNSFHPNLGFFLHVDEVLAWFGQDSASFDQQLMSLQNNLHEPLLKEDLACWRCRETFKAMPKLKEHLVREKGAEASREKKSLQGKKRKRPEEGETGRTESDREVPSSKRQAVTNDVDT